MATQQERSLLLIGGIFSLPPRSTHYYCDLLSVVVVELPISTSIEDDCSCCCELMLLLPFVE